jgi:hypothetical protein
MSETWFVYADRDARAALAVADAANDALGAEHDDSDEDRVPELQAEIHEPDEHGVRLGGGEAAFVEELDQTLREA